MTIAVDLDDVTVNLSTDLNTYHNETYNTKVLIEEHHTFDLSITWKCTPEEAMKRVYDFYHSDHMDEVPPIDGAIEGILALSTQHTIAFVTSRPDFLHEKTKNWITKYIGDKDFPVYFTNQFTKDEVKKVTKSFICKQINAGYMIEDNPAYAYDCAENGIQVLLFDRPWNRSIENTETIHRVLSWEDILKYMHTY